MALIKGKFIRLENAQFLKGKKADGSDKDIIKINSSDQVEFSEAPILGQDPTAPNQMARKGYVDSVGSAAVSYADGQMAQEVSQRQAEDLGLSNRLNTLEADPTTKTYVDGQISSLIGGAPEMLNTLKEISDAIANDASVGAALAATVGQVDAKVDLEITNRQSADSALSGRLDVLEADPTTKTYVDGQVAGEALDRNTAVMAEASRAQGEESRIEGKVDAEQTRAMGEEDRIEGKVDQEVLDRQSAVSGEASARQTADVALSGRLDVLEADPVTKTYVDTWGGNEAQLREAADTAEASARQLADSALSGRLATLEADPVTKAYVDTEVAGAKSYTDGKISDLIGGAPAMLDTLKEISDAIGSGSDVATGLAGSISQEVADRQAADLVLDGKITTEKNRAEGEEARIEAKVDAETARAQGQEAAIDTRFINNEAAFASEVSRAQLAESGLQSQISQEVSDRQSAVSSEQTRAQNAEQGLQGQITQEISDRQSAVSAEQTRAQGVEAGLNTRVTAIEALPAIRAQKDVFTLSAQDVTNGYVETANLAMDNTVMMITGGVVHNEVESYTMSVSGAVSRLTFAGDLAAAGVNPLASGDKVYCQYLTKDIVSSGGGGGGSGGGGSGGGGSGALLDSVTFLMDDPFDQNNNTEVWSLAGSFDPSVATYTVEWNDWNNPGTYLPMNMNQSFPPPPPGAPYGIKDIRFGKPGSGSGHTEMAFRVKVTENGVDSAWFPVVTHRS